MPASLIRWRISKYCFENALLSLRCAVIDTESVIYCVSFVVITLRCHLLRVIHSGLTMNDVRSTNDAVGI
jgi:hypothetical protein